MTALAMFAINYLLVGGIYVWALLGYMERHPAERDLFRGIMFVAAVGYTLFLWPVALVVGAREYKRRGR